jgi:hypothetical protein
MSFFAGTEVFTVELGMPFDGTILVTILLSAAFILV